MKTVLFHPGNVTVLLQRWSQPRRTFCTDFFAFPSVKLSSQHFYVFLLFQNTEKEINQLCNQLILILIQEHLGTGLGTDWEHFGNGLRTGK